MLLGRDDILIPVSIFSGSHGPLESLVLYLKDQKGMAVPEIALRLNRDRQTIWSTYYRVRGSTLEVKPGISVPLSLFLKNKASMLESLSHYLRDILGLSNAEIAAILRRDSRTIFTCYRRFSYKVNAHKRRNNSKEASR